MRDSISLSVYYGAELPFHNSVVLALSQSGRTPDVVSYVERARKRGAFTIGVTNDADSDLAHAAELTLPLYAGEERAVAASKTLLNTFAVLALLAGCAAGRGDEVAAAVQEVAEQMRKALPGLEDAVVPIATTFAYVGRMYVTGRGIELGTAREIALKLTETCRIAAESVTSTDLSHGPIAAVDAMFPVWTIASQDQALPTIVEAARRARDAGATLVASCNAHSEIDGAAYRLPVPAAPSTLLAPLLSVVPGQLFAGAVARAKGLDPDRPRGLSKVTLAR